MWQEECEGIGFKNFNAIVLEINIGKSAIAKLSDAY